MSKETNEPKIKGSYKSTRANLPERVANTPHTSTDSEISSHAPKPKGDYKHGDGSLAHDKTTRKNLPGVRKGGESTQK